MNPREITEQIESQTLSEYGVKSRESMGRAQPEEDCDSRTVFQRDRDRIIHSKAFRRLMHKTQVFISPEGDHYRTRLTHTLEVSQISRTISRALRLNEDLTEAIALGHDLGHTPFGHDGEYVLDKLSPGGFLHNEQSVRVVERLEKNGQGLNLTAEVLDGILNHPLKCRPSTLEGRVVQLSDKIAYINHDIDDALRAGVLCEADLPGDVVDMLGGSSRERIDFLVRDTIAASMGKDWVNMQPYVYSAMKKLYDFMFENVYLSKAKNYQLQEIKPIITRLYEYFQRNMGILPEEFINAGGDCVCDYIACMTDRFALRTYAEITGDRKMLEMKEWNLGLHLASSPQATSLRL